MSLLLTRHIDEDRIHRGAAVGYGLRGEDLHPALPEPLADQLALQTITLHHEHALHGRQPP